MADSGRQKRMVTGDEERWANLASLRVFNKPLAAVIEDFERAKGGISPETLASLIELGKEIEAADASRATASPASKSTGTNMPRFRHIVKNIAVWSFIAMTVLGLGFNLVRVVGEPWSTIAAVAFVLTIAVTIVSGLTWGIVDREGRSWAGVLLLLMLLGALAGLLRRR